MGKNHGSTEPAKWSWLVLCLGVWAGLPWLGRVSGQDQVQSLGLVSGPAAGPQRNVALAFSPAGIRYLAVWDDKRPSAFGEENIRGRFIGQGADFPICEAAGEQKRPSLAPIDDGFMVFWEDRRNNSDPKGPRDIFTAKVTTGGIVQPIGGRQLSFGAADESDVEAAGNRKGTIAVWETSGPEPGLYASRTGPTGLALDATPFPVVRRQFSQPSEPDVAANDDGFMIVWESDEETRRIMGIFVKWDPGGEPQVGPEFEVGPFLEGEHTEEVCPPVAQTSTNRRFPRGLCPCANNPPHPPPHRTEEVCPIILPRAHRTPKRSVPSPKRSVPLSCPAHTASLRAHTEEVCLIILPHTSHHTEEVRLIILPRAHRITPRTPKRSVPLSCPTPPITPKRSVSLHLPRGLSHCAPPEPKRPV